MARAKHRRTRPPAGGRSRLWWWPLAVVALAGLTVAGVTGAEGGLTASVANVGDSTQTANLVTAASAGSTSECDLSGASNNPIAASNTADCAGTLAPAGALPSSGSGIAATTIADKGSAAATGAGLAVGACGPVAMADSAAPSDPMLVRGATLTYDQSGPLAGGSGLGLSGGSGYAADVTSAPGPTSTSFSELVWFKTTTGGTLIGFTNIPTSARASQWDKILWVDNTGHIVFAVYPGKTVELTTTGTYADGAWHLVVATLSTATGMSLSVDGGPAVTNTNKAAQSYNGYWHVGWDNERTGWSNPPTDPFFNGTLADAATLPTALTSGQIATLYSAGSQAAWNADLVADGADHSWSLGDTGTTPYTGAVPGVSANPCSFVDATIGAATSSTTCAAPASTSACPAPSAAVTLMSLAGGTLPFSVYPAPSQDLTVTVTVARDQTDSTSAYPDAVGLHITAAASVAAEAGTFSATLTWPAEDLML